MAFNKKTWVNRVVQYPIRRLLTIVRNFDATGTAVMDIQREDGIITTEGDAFSAANMNDLEDRIDNSVTSIETEVAKKLEKVTSMPTASASLVGTTVIYAGATDSNYTEGYTYKCKEVSTGVYSWVHIGATEITVDSSLNTTSTNPAENRKITSAICAALGKLATTDLNNGGKASFPHSKGDWLIYGTTENPSFGQCQAAISVNETFNSASGGNITNEKISDVLTSLNNDLTILSTSEKRVGTDENGNAIYQITIPFSSNQYTDSGNRRSFSLNIPNITGNVIGVKCGYWKIVSGTYYVGNRLSYGNTNFDQGLIPVYHFAVGTTNNKLFASLSITINWGTTAISGSVTVFYIK